MDKPQAVCEDKYGGLHRLFYQHIDAWQLDMDYIIYAGQESRLNTFHLRSIRRILGISWLDKVANAYVLSRAGLPSMYTLLRQCRLRWLGHVRRMDDGRIPKYILYGELALGRRTTGHPHLRYKDVCVRDMKAVDIDTMSWEGLAVDRTKWRSALKQHLTTGKDKLMTDPADKRARTTPRQQLHDLPSLHELMQISLEPFDSQPTGVVASLNEDHLFKSKCSCLPITWMHPFCWICPSALHTAPHMF